MTELAHTPVSTKVAIAVEFIGAGGCRFLRSSGLVLTCQVYALAGGLKTRRSYCIGSVLIEANSQTARIPEAEGVSPPFPFVLSSLSSACERNSAGKATQERLSTVSI